MSECTLDHNKGQQKSAMSGRCLDLIFLIFSSWFFPFCLRRSGPLRDHGLDTGQRIAMVDTVLRVSSSVAESPNPQKCRGGAGESAREKGVAGGDCWEQWHCSQQSSFSWHSPPHSPRRFWGFGLNDREFLSQNTFARYATTLNPKAGLGLRRQRGGRQPVVQAQILVGQGLLCGGILQAKSAVLLYLPIPACQGVPSRPKSLQKKLVTKNILEAITT